MNAIRIHKHLVSPAIDVPELAPLVGKNVEIIVLEESDPPAMPLPACPKAGTAKGMVSMSPDFDAPLEDFAEYTE